MRWAAALVLLLLWPLAAFGGRGPGTAIPFGVVAVLFAIAVDRSAHTRIRTAGALDLAIVATVAAVFLQALPLPAALAERLSPNASALRGALTLDPGSRGWFTLSIAAADTLWAAAVAAGAAAVFFAARTIVARGGLRQTVRGVSALGFLFSAIAIAQAATAGRSIYWRFPTEYEGPLPFGPFVNRNHFATWVIMAAPLCAGYLAARANGPEETDAAFVSVRTRIARRADGRMVWLTAAGALMIAALLLSLSRSGIAALSGAAIVTLVALRRGSRRGRGWWLLGMVAVMIGLGISRADLPALAERFTRSGSSVENRFRIWEDTVPMVRDFWLTGTGAGTYRTAMLYYQRSTRVVQFNQAHNHYLQVAAEGGMVLLALVGWALAALAGAARNRFGSADTLGTYWIRAGAVCGLLAVSFQSLWETGLVMPANAALAAVLAAIAVHERATPEKSIFMD